ncbi:hypothetical protein QPK87_30230 [Kamptonema cortianum]|nr:hypothetical protein [Kamptonema cortianum]
MPKKSLTTTDVVAECEVLGAKCEVAAEPADAEELAESTDERELVPPVILDSEF